MVALKVVGVSASFFSHKEQFIVPHKETLGAACHL